MLHVGNRKGRIYDYTGTSFRRECITVSTIGEALSAPQMKHEFHTQTTDLLADITEILRQGFSAPGIQSDDSFFIIVFLEVDTPNDKQHGCINPSGSLVHPTWDQQRCETVYNFQVHRWTRSRNDASIG